MPAIARKKYFRSSFLEKPASCETLFSRMSITRWTPAAWSFVKNSSAVFFVKPMVKILIAPSIKMSTPLPRFVRAIRRTRSARPAGRRPLRSGRPCSETTSPRACSTAPRAVLRFLVRLDGPVFENVPDRDVVVPQVAADEDRAMAGERVLLGADAARRGSLRTARRRKSSPCRKMGNWATRSYWTRGPT